MEVPSMAYIWNILSEVCILKSARVGPGYPRIKRKIKIKIAGPGQTTSWNIGEGRNPRTKWWNNAYSLCSISNLDKLLSVFESSNFGM